MIGNVWNEVDVCPAGIDISFASKKIRFFMGDRWVDVGPVAIRLDGKICSVEVPDMDELLQEHMLADDGAAEWVEWGPRLN